MGDWPTPKPTEWPTPSKSKDWWTPSTTEEEPEYKWTTESIEEWPSKKEDEPSKDSNKYSAASANVGTDGTSAPTPAPTDDDMKDAFIIVWKPLDLLTFVLIVGILVVLITFCFVIRGVCFGNKEAVRGAKIISDYDSDDSTDDEVYVERQRFH